MLSSGSLRTILREFLPAALLAVLLLTFMSRTWNANDPFDSREGWGPNPRGTDASVDATWEAKLQEWRTLPAYQEAAQTLDDLHDARAAVLKAASASDGNAMLAPAERYRGTLQRVQAKLSQLKDYLDPNDEEDCLRDLFQQSLSGDLGDGMILEIRTGIIAGVNSE